MNYQSALVLSVLLVLGLAHASASPLGRVLSRLRKQAGAGGLSSASSLRIRYRHLYAITRALSEDHKTLYEDFKNERYPNDTNPRVYDMVLAYLPDTTSFPSNRINHSDDQLLGLHYDNLVIFKDTLDRVKETETGNITDKVNTVAEKLDEVISRLTSSLMAVNGGAPSTAGPPTIIPPFHTNVTTGEHNTRTLLVLQKFDGYITEVVIDYLTLKTRYARSSN